MQQAYPVILTKDGDSFIAEFPDDRRDIPKPSKLKSGQHSVVLPPLIASKLAIYQAMRDQGVTQSELADKLCCDARQVRRLLDLDHHSRMDLIDDALHELGKKLVVDIQPLVMPKSKDGKESRVRA
jgi:antitoxin HicB